jgi:hypothetical protein
MRFSTDRLYATGYQHRYGISELHARALDSLTGTCTIFSRRAVNYLFLPSICIELGIADAEWQNI